MLNIISHRQLLSNVQFLVTPWTGPARIPYPWNSLGKHTGVGSHFLLQRIFLSQGSNPSPQLQADSFLFFFFYYYFFFSSTTLLLPTHLPPPSCTHAQSCHPMDFSPPDSSTWTFPGKNTGVGCHFLLLQADSLPSEPPGKPVSHQGIAK